MPGGQVSPEPGENQNDELWQLITATTVSNRAFAGSTS
jgi:hypothetical protein